MPSLCDFRLSLATHTGVTVSDLTSQGTLYLTPMQGIGVGDNGSAWLSLYDGTRWKQYASAQISLVLSQSSIGGTPPTGNTVSGTNTIKSMSSTTGLYPGQPIIGTGIPSGTVIVSKDSGTQITVSANATATNSGITLTIYPAMYDVFVYDNGGTLTLELVKWTDNSTRTALDLQDGQLVKNATPTHRYVGTMRVTALNKMEDSQTQRFLWNNYNRVPRLLSRQETAASWSYATATWRQANANTANQVEVVIGVPGVFVDLILSGAGKNNTAGEYGDFGIGEDSTTAVESNSTAASWVAYIANAVAGSTAVLKKYPTAGYHTYAWLEAGSGTGTATWYGNTLQSAHGTNPGLRGYVMG